MYVHIHKHYVAHLSPRVAAARQAMAGRLRGVLRAVSLRRAAARAQGASGAAAQRACRLQEARDRWRYVEGRVGPVTKDKVSLNGHARP